MPGTKKIMRNKNNVHDLVLFTGNVAHKVGKPSFTFSTILVLFAAVALIIVTFNWSDFRLGLWTCSSVDLPAHRPSN